jgi:16S rRNA processing protein RimM
MADDALVPIAFVTDAHGLGGELRIKLLNPSSDLLSERKDVIVRRGADDPGRRVAIRSTHSHRHGVMLLGLADCRDRNAAEALRGSELCVPRTELPELAEGEYYLLDLIGLTVKTADGNVVGRVQDAFEYPASQALRVRVEAGDIEVPLLPPYVVDIRLDERTVIVDHLEDFDIERAR